MAMAADAESASQVRTAARMRAFLKRPANVGADDMRLLSLGCGTIDLCGGTRSAITIVCEAAIVNGKLDKCDSWGRLSARGKILEGISQMPKENHRAG